MCRACDAAEMRLDAALALREACEGPRISALRRLYRPTDPPKSMTAMAEEIDRLNGKA